MKFFNKLKLIVYPELRKLNYDNDKIDKILSNKNFNSQYKNIIKPFIKYLNEYKYSEYNNGVLTEKHLDQELINEHFNNVLNLSINNNSDRYVSFLKQYSYEKKNILNYEVFNDQNFEKLYAMIGESVFDKNISDVIESGNSEKLIQFMNNNVGIIINNLNPLIFEDKVWNIINNNSTLGNKSILELFNNKLDVLVDLVNNNLFDGLKYTYENILESHNFIENQLGTMKSESISLQQFSMSFIGNIGDETLKQLYSHNIFVNEEEFKILFKIVEVGNYELIKDLVSYDKNAFSFKNISNTDISKSLLEIDYGNKSEVFLSKYFGVEKNEAHYVRLFLDSINKVSNLPENFRLKYESVLQLLNKVISASDEELIEFSKTMDLNKKDDYKKLIYMCEKEGNNILRSQFSSDLKDRSEQIINSATHKQIMTDAGTNVDVYELSGQPFTMLVHAVVDNKYSTNNSFVSEIVSNPENWDKINDGNDHISTSLISDKYMVTYGIPDNNNTVMFGFDNVPSNSVKFTSVSDAGIDRNVALDSSDEIYNMRNSPFVSDVNTVTTVDELMLKTVKKNIGLPQASRQWNEVGLSRIDEQPGLKIRPNYVVCMDNISDSSIKAAEYFNIPIYLIDRKHYLEIPYVAEDTNHLTIPNAKVI